MKAFLRGKRYFRFYSSLTLARVESKRSVLLQLATGWWCTSCVAVGISWRPRAVTNLLKKNKSDCTIWMWNDDSSSHLPKCVFLKGPLLSKLCELFRRCKWEINPVELGNVPSVKSKLWVLGVRPKLAFDLADEKRPLPYNHLFRAFLLITNAE